MSAFAAQGTSASDPWLTVVIPTYNGGRYLRSTLASIERERPVGIEIIAVDDGSSDATMDILTSSARTLPIRLVRGPGRAGWVGATNIGAREARGTWLCMLHQDDLWLPGRLRSLQHTSSHNPHAGLLVGESEFLDESGRRIGRWRLPWHGTPPQPTEMARRLYVQNWLALPSCAVKTNLLKALNYLDEDLWYTADWDLWLRLVRDAPIAIAHGVLSGFRIHGSSQTVERSADIGAFESQMRTVQERHRWAADGRSDVLAAGEMSTLTNVALASLLHRGRFPASALARQALRLRGGGWRRFARDSRIVDRAGPRIRLAVRSRSAAAWPISTTT
ncbi:MAG: glycosyltransferase [Candidatus Dormibacteraeota bacterium]|uniref:Glycosyltransferase n=1 Tax=Candidatus Aeolococcus gillhamiae TaxID=3127015 RepID=A0A2W6AA65_9BACT|nr:glycosyltransferase [Candidatus Dormibacteraeota bacterium]PZR82218.1 MAG: hypothetical protein DLM65_04405 [Candidatus Dormibacter sp. RRmetagenome_bin12]